MVNIMEKSISFRELVKKIHPDTNPTIVDAGGKMRIAVLYKKDQSLLYEYGVKWGVIGKPSKPTKPTKPVYNRTRPDNGNTFHPGDLVYIKTRKCYSTVTRVTSKSVFFKDYNGTERWVSFRSVYKDTRSK